MSSDSIHESGSELSAVAEDPPPGGYAPERRRFLAYMMYALGALIGAILGIPLIGYVLEPLLQSPRPVWRVVGRVSDFRVGSTALVAFENAYTPPRPPGGISSREAAWLRRNSASSFTAFSIYCQHLGCPVTWQPGPELFFCPCHGGVYYPDGTVAAGPPPRRLQQYRTRIRNGNVELLTGPIPFPY
jgi:menaquinol-cytochrome c reductase iron-sulfur subunit